MRTWLGIRDSDKVLGRSAAICRMRCWRYFGWSKRLSNLRLCSQKILNFCFTQRDGEGEACSRAH